MGVYYCYLALIKWSSGGITIMNANMKVSGQCRIAASNSEKYITDMPQFRGGNPYF